MSLLQGNLPDPGIEPGSPAWQVDSLPAEPNSINIRKKKKVAGGYESCFGDERPSVHCIPHPPLVRSLRTELVASFSPRTKQVRRPLWTPARVPLSVRGPSGPSQMLQPHPVVLLVLPPSASPIPAHPQSSIFSLSLQGPLFRFSPAATGQSLKQTESTPELRSARPLPSSLPRDFLEPVSCTERTAFTRPGPSAAPFPPPS